MKKTMVSLAAVAALTTGAFAADKGIDIVTTGQAVVYYQTSETDNTATSDLFDKGSSSANVGVQLNLDADLKNNFTFGSQLTYLGTSGLESNLVGDTRQVSLTTNATGSGADVLNNTTDQIMLTKIFVAKKVGNTTVKLGRQELPKSLSPLAYTEGWNVFKNTFDAILAVNTDLPDTTLVGAYVGGTTGHDLSTVATFGTGTALGGGAYMLTAQNKSLPMATITGTYYRVTHVADAMWLNVDVASKDLPMGLKVSVQAGNIDLDAAATRDTDAYGIKASIKPMDALTLCAAYTDVNDGTLAVQNLGTGVKSPLYTQMVSNQTDISTDADTYMLKAAYSLGDMGTVIAQYADTDDNSAAKADYAELDVIYKVKAGGVDYLAAYVMQNEKAAGTNDTDIVRVWARYNF